MSGALTYVIIALGLWTAVQVLAVRRLTFRFQELRARNVEQDRPVRG